MSGSALGAVTRLNLEPGAVGISPASLPASADHYTIAMRMVGLCGSDAHIYRADHSYDLVRPGTILGHEGVGVIERLPDSPNATLSIGDRVIPLSILGCQKCAECKVGQIQRCHARHTLGITTDGLLQEKVSIQEHNLVVVPDHIPDSTAVLTEPCAVACHGILKSLNGLSNSHIVISGTGTIAWLSALTAKHLGHDVVVIGRESPRTHQYRYIARQLDLHFEENRVSLTPDVWIECSGSTTQIEQAANHLRPGGRLCLIALYSSASSLDWNTLIRREIDILTSYGATAKDFEKALELLSHHSKLGEILTHIYSFSDSSLAFKACSGQLPSSHHFPKNVIRLPETAADS